MGVHVTRRTALSVRVTWLLLLLGWAAPAAVFFRGPLFSGFRLIDGDDGDARFVVYLHEHWVLALRGLASWRDPGFFSPAADTLGYSDTFVLDELFYAPLRWMGLDQFVAYQFTLILLSLVGYLGAYFLFTAVLLGRRLMCAVLAMTFAFSNMLYVQAGHSQLYAVYWLPTILLLLSRARGNSAVAPASAVVAGLAVGLLLLSTFYVAWFFILGSVLWVVVRGVLWRLGERGRFLVSARRWVPVHRGSLVGLVVGAAIGGIPFVLVYAPNLGLLRNFDVVINYGAQPSDLFNTGAHNLLWGPLTLRVLNHSPRLGNGELAFGLTPIVLFALVCSTVYLVTRYRRDAGSRRATGSALAAAATCWLAITLPMKVFGVWLWYPIWLLVPGAKAIRAIDRFAIIAGLVTPLVVAFVVADLIRTTAPLLMRRRKLAGIAAVVVMMAAEQLNIGQNARVDRQQEVTALAAVPTPPADCRAFYLTVRVDPAPVWYVSSIDAMLIAHEITSRGIPMETMNGYSGQFPPGFGAAAYPGDTHYGEAISSWRRRFGMTTGVCAYDQLERRWTPADSTR